MYHTRKRLCDKMVSLELAVHGLCELYFLCYMHLMPVYSAKWSLFTPTAAKLSSHAVHHSSYPFSLPMYVRLFVAFSSLKQDDDDTNVLWSDILSKLPVWNLCYSRGLGKIFAQSKGLIQWAPRLYRLYAWKRKEGGRKFHLSWQISNWFISTDSIFIHWTSNLFRRW